MDDNESVKKKDPTRGVEAAIQEAMRQGKFKDLPGEGKPLDLSAYFDTPEDLRVAFALLKDANFLPEEVELLKEVQALKEQLLATQDGQEKQRIRKQMEARRLKYNLLMERLKKR